MSSLRLDISNSKHLGIYGKYNFGQISVSITRALKLGCYKTHIWVRVTNQRFYKVACNFVSQLQRDVK